MPCTAVFRTACSFLNKVPTLLSRECHAHWFLEHRLLTSRHFASISKACGPQNLEVKSIDLKKRETSDPFYSHNRCFGQENTEGELNSSGVKKLNDKTIQRLKDGYTKVRDARDVTSLPPQINLDNAQYIAVEAKTSSSSPASDLIFIHAVSDTEQFIKICRHDGGLSVYHRISLGLDCDENGNVRSSSGQLMETVEPQEALQEFLKFIKKYDNTILLAYEGCPSVVQKLRYSFMHFGLYDEFISASPYYIDLFHMARMNIPPRFVSSYKLQDLCKELLDMDVNRDPISRVTGMKKLFTDVLLWRGFSSVIKCTDYLTAKDCYAEMVAEKSIQPLVVEKLASAGLRLDHLKFLKQQGLEEFEKQLKKYSIFGKDSAMLFTLI